MKKPLLYCALALLACPAYAEQKPDVRLAPIQHIIVISLENHSFDNLFGLFPSAEGIAQSKATATQAARDGRVYETLPAVMDTRVNPPKPDPRFPKDIGNGPFAIDKYAPADEETGDLVHRFDEEQEEIDGGRMDRFAALSGVGGLTMGYYDGSTLGLWKYAQRYTLADHFFHAAFGGSFLNHMWLICACTPRFPDAPESYIRNQTVTEDGYAVNTIFSAQSPHPKAMEGSGKLLPPQDLPTIGDRLSDKGVSWAWYAGGWNDAIAGKPDKSFQFHHQPFAYFKAYADDSAARREHLKDEADFLDALKNNTLPAVVFYKPLGELNMHPGYSDVDSGDRKTMEILRAIEHSKAWGSSVVIVTFDENGGFWDHVPPPKADRWGPGVRVPTIILSPFAKKHFVDHTVYDTTSILKFIESRFGLAPLTSRDAAASNLLNALDLH